VLENMVRQRVTSSRDAASKREQTGCTAGARSANHHKGNSRAVLENTSTPPAADHRHRAVIPRIRAAVGL